MVKPSMNMQFLNAMIGVIGGFGAGVAYTFVRKLGKHPDTVDNAKANEGWAKLQQIVEDYKKDHNGASVYAPSFIEDCEPAVKKLQEEYGFEYTVEYVK